MINNATLPPVTQPSVQRPSQSPGQAQDQTQSPSQTLGREAPTRKPETQEQASAVNRKVEYIPAIPDEEAIEALRSARSEFSGSREGPTAAYGNVEAMSETSNRGRLLDVFA